MKAMYYESGDDVGKVFTGLLTDRTFHEKQHKSASLSRNYLI